MRTIKDIPFIDISRENLMAANDFLDREQKGELLEMIIDTVLNGVEPTSDDRAVTGVYNQFMAVIGRKAEGVIKKLNALDEVNAEKKKGKEEPVIEAQEFNQDFSNEVTIADDGFDKDLDKARQLKAAGDWRFEHHINDMKNKYLMRLEEIVERL